MSAEQRDRWRDERRQRERRGRWAEIAAATALMLKGYRIAGRRIKTPAGEIDLIAIRGRRVAFVEVKQRASLADAEASITDRQRQRVRRAASHWLGKQSRYQSFEQRFDLVFVMPRRWPCHIENGL